MRLRRFNRTLKVGMMKCYMDLYKYVHKFLSSGSYSKNIDFSCIWENEKHRINMRFGWAILNILNLEFEIFICSYKIINI